VPESTTTYRLDAFHAPANQQDLPDPLLQEQFDELWSTNVDGFVRQAIVGNPWNATYQSNQTSYYNELEVDIPSDAAPVAILWNAFPNRISEYFGADSSTPNPYNFDVGRLRQLADTAELDGKSFPQIPQVRCPEPDWSGPLQDYGPFGPRGWQDEYCEWSVTRDANGSIVRVDFTAENPEYWYTLWRVDPETAAAVYEQTLNFDAPPERQIKVTVEDLQLVDPSSGEPVIDPSTGRPAYNPFNKWNSGTVSVRGTATDSGGAMHLTSTPNTVQTEIALGAGASVLRQVGNGDPQALICCGQYGQNFRHSDPHIGQVDNIVVSEGNLIALTDPIALYMQMPDLSGYELPDDPKLPPDAQPSDCWHVLRGVETMTDPVTGQPYPGNMLLHCVFQLPLAWIEAGVSFAVGDIRINGEPIAWGSQIVETLGMGTFARPIPAPTPQEQPCVGTPNVSLAAPEQSMHEALWDAYYATNVPNPVGHPMNAASNTVIVAPIVEQGGSARLVVTCGSVTLGPNDEPPSVVFPPGDVRAEVENVIDVTYAVPGNSYPSESQALFLVVDVAPDAATGLREIQVTNFGQQPGEPAPAFLAVVAPS
jgi:hypothetical protein